MIYKGQQIQDCNCGGPSYGTDHAPDCAMILDAEDVDHDDSEEIQEEVTS